MTEKLVFHLHGHAGSNTCLSPRYYIEADCTPKVVRIYAETAPDTEAKFDIFDDDVSIFEDQGGQTLNLTTGAIGTAGAGTSVSLTAEQNSEDSIERFNSNIIEQGSWVHCEVVDTGNGRDFTVILELEE